MDGGPYRGSRPAARKTVSRSETAHRQPEETARVYDEPKPVHATTPRHIASVKDQKSFSDFLKPIIAGIILLIILIAGVVGWLAWSNSQNGTSSAIDDSKYQAVFFTNGQVYFGKLDVVDRESMTLTDVYYLQTQSANKTEAGNPQETSNDQSDVQLIKLGDEIHGPEDKMIISKDQVLFYENLKPDGKVAESIKKFKNN